MSLREFLQPTENKTNSLTFHHIIVRKLNNDSIKIHKIMLKLSIITEITNTTETIFQANILWNVSRQIIQNKYIFIFSYENTSPE